MLTIEDYPDAGTLILSNTTQLGTSGMGLVVKTTPESLVVVGEVPQTVPQMLKLILVTVEAGEGMVNGERGHVLLDSLQTAALHRHLGVLLGEE